MNAKRARTSTVTAGERPVRLQKGTKTMLDDKIRADFDQAKSTLAETFPPWWRELYVSCIREGFSEEESMDLVKTYILSCSPNGVKGT